MCGITGIFDRTGTTINISELLAMRDAMTVRGPDGRGVWTASTMEVGLGHRRLAILDTTDAGAQPMVRERHVIVFNGEIYNHRILRNELEARGYIFRSKSDTEVLLFLYAEYGPAMLTRLRGMFAFAIWDCESRKLFLARDPFGIKPLYWSDDGHIFRFASQVKALLKAPVDTAPAPAGHAGFFLWGSVPEPWTLYRGIRAIPAGHWLYVNSAGTEGPVEFAGIRSLLRNVDPSELSRENAVGSLGDAIEDSVSAHLESDVPVGVFLSSGLDSALLASKALATNSNLNTVTLGFAEYFGTSNDEVPLAEALAQTLGSDQYTQCIRRTDFLNERENLLNAMDQPSIDGVNTWFVARAAASRGLKVALSGLGGDELFASYPSFRDVPLMARMLRYPSRFPGAGKAMRFASAPLFSGMGSPKYAALLEYGGTMGGAYFLRRGLFMPWELPSVIDPDLAREGWQDLMIVANLNAVAAGISDSRLAVTALEMSGYMRNQLLRDADWAGMAHSIEIRTPFVDWPMLLASAPIFRAYPSLTKREVVAAAAPRLPDMLLTRRKTGFSVPVTQWLQDKSEPAERGLRDWARQVYEHFRLPS